LAKFDLFESIYRLYSKDLSYTDFEKLIKKESPDVYAFYLSKMEYPDDSKNRFFWYLKFIGNLFIAFLKRMTPSRRIIYSMSLFLFFYGYFSARYYWTVIGFLGMNLLLAFELANKLTAQDELDVARDIQINLMPRTAPKIDHLDIAFHLSAASEVGGDYFDFVNPKNNGKNYLVIGDISGKGMAAALYMVQVQAILHYLFDSFSSLKEVLVELNKSVKRIFQNNYFFTVTIADISQKDKISFYRAGHLPVFYDDSNKKNETLLTPECLGIGLSDKEIFEKSLIGYDLSVKKDDILCFYTDGVTEAMDKNKNLFGEKRFIEIIERNVSKSADEIKNEIKFSIDNFLEHDLKSDDLTFIVVKVK